MQPTMRSPARPFAKAGRTSIVQRNSDLKSAAIRQTDGTMLAQAGHHPRVWRTASDGKSTTDRMSVAIRSQGQQWGQLEASFENARHSGILALLFGPLGPLTAFVAAAGFFINFFYLRTVLQQLEPRIPFHAVTALISALAYRDQATAEHSRRVADLAVAPGSQMLSNSECYVLEIAALLHDIGKIGVPDSILLKPGPLTPEEWKIMRTHDRIGTEIIEASFHSAPLSSIIRFHHAFFGGSSRDPQLPSGLEIPLGARILSICDSYDAIVSDRVYRRGQSPEAALAELRRCAGTQFDPQLVERFAAVLQSHRSLPAESTANLSRVRALAVGLQLERLATALDDQDLQGLRVLAHRLHDVAVSQGADEIALSSARLEACLESDSDLLEVMGAAHELLNLCRSKQRSCINAAVVSCGSMPDIG